LRVLIIGAGERTRAVLGRLGDRWEAVVIDTDPGRLDRAAAVRPITPVQGDPSSRVVLKRAGLLEADAVVVASLDDEVGVEVCRFAKEAGIARIVAVAAELDNLPAYRKLGVPAFSAAQLAARHVEINLEPRRVASAAFADGQAEAVEFRISPDSPLRGRPLSELGLSRWLVAAVLRGGSLIVPNGQTVLETDDLVTVVGSAADYGAMVATFTGGEAHFPLGFGKQAAVLLADGPAAEATVNEAARFVRSTAAEALLLIHEDPARLAEEKAKALTRRLDALAEAHPNVAMRPTAVRELGPEALAAAAARESVGVLVLPLPRGRLAAVAALELLRRVNRPGLFAAGVEQYGSVVTPARDTERGWAAAWTAIDLAARGDLPLVALGVVPPRFLAGDQTEAQVRAAVARIRDEASVHGVSVSGRIAQGNPVRIFAEIERGTLIVLGVADRRRSWLVPGNAGHILSRVRTSIVIVPDRRPT
jgi:Trk K+ transport system NAD-binding subunit